VVGEEEEANVEIRDIWLFRHCGNSNTTRSTVGPEVLGSATGLFAIYVTAYRGVGLRELSATYERCDIANDTYGFEKSVSLERKKLMRSVENSVDAG